MDYNLSRYVSNSVLDASDPSGLNEHHVVRPGNENDLTFEKKSLVIPTLRSVWCSKKGMASNEWGQLNTHASDEWISTGGMYGSSVTLRDDSTCNTISGTLGNEGGRFNAGINVIGLEPVIYEYSVTLSISIEQKRNAGNTKTALSNGQFFGRLNLELVDGSGIGNKKNLDTIAFAFKSVTYLREKISLYLLLPIG